MRQVNLKQCNQNRKVSKLPRVFDTGLRSLAKSQRRTI